MATLTCPYCKAISSFQIVWTGSMVPRVAGSIANAQFAVLQCSNTDCWGAVASVVQGLNVVRYWPTSVGGKDFPDVPDAIAATASEAHLCLSAGASRGAIALARAVVESVAKFHGINGGLLHAKIEKMAEQGVISPAMKEAADELRFAGNEVAHGDLVDEPISAEDATDVLGLMDAILLRVFQEPAQVAKVRERRQARGSS